MMKLTDIINERREIPVEEKVDIDVLKEYMFKDWQIFNEKIVPTYRHLRNKVMRESYSESLSTSNFFNVVNFGAKKYMAECTSRKYFWNEIFSKKDRYKLAEALRSFFEEHNLSEESGIIVEQEGGSKEARITFSEIEVELQGNKPVFVINMNFDAETQNFVTNAIGKGESVHLSQGDMETIKGTIKAELIDATSGKGLSYLKFIVTSSIISREDLKILMSGAFMNRLVTLEVGPDNTATDPEGMDEPIESPEQDPRMNNKAGFDDNEINEIINESIKKLTETRNEA